MSTVNTIRTPNQTPKNLKELSSLGTPSPNDEWLYQLWDNAWNKGDIGIASRAVVRDESPIDLDEPGPLPNILVMEKFHRKEFALFKISDVYVRDSFIDLAHSIIKLHGGHHASSVTAGFTNPFTGVKTNQQKVAIVLGTPGNGKTVFLYFLLRCRLQAKLPTILQLDSNSLFIFSEFGVHVFPESPIPNEYAPNMVDIAPDMWCLVDSNNSNHTPSNFLQFSTLSIVQASSPRRSRIDWAKKSNINVHRLFMPPFTLKEAIIARSLQITGSSEDQLQGWFNRYVPSARLAYRNAATASEYEEDILPGLFASHPYGMDSVQALADKALSFADDELSHQVFVFIPSTNYKRPTCCVPTRHLSMKLIERCRLENNEQRKQCYRIFLSIPQLAAPAGYLLVHALLPLGGCWPLLTLSTHDHQVNQHWKVDHSKTYNEWLVIDPKEIPPVFKISPAYLTNSRHRGSLKVEGYDTLEKLADHCFYIPNSPNQSTFDSFYHSAKHVYMFQCTVTGAQHTVNHKGLNMMAELGVEKVTYIGVVPVGQEPNFVIAKSTAETYEKLLHARYLLQISPDSF